MDSGLAKSSVQSSSRERAGSRKQQAENPIRQAIAVGLFPVGTRLIETEISRELGLRNFLEVDGCGIWH